MLIAMAVQDTEKNNRTWMTEATLRSLAETVDWSKHKLMISDNDSCNATHALYMTMIHLLPVRIACNGSNVGTSRAINRVWRHRGQGEHCAKIDNDVVIHQPGWADWMEDVFERDPEIGIVGLKRKDLAESRYVRMLPHKKGQRWLAIEEARGIMGTCLAYSSALLDKIGYLTQPGIYGYDDSLASVRARVAGFKCAYLHGFELEHLGLDSDAYAQWKIAQAAHYRPEYNTRVALYESGAISPYHDGDFDIPGSVGPKTRLEIQ